MSRLSKSAEAARATAKRERSQHTPGPADQRKVVLARRDRRRSRQVPSRRDEESPAVRARRNPCHRRARSVPDREGNYGDSPRLTAAQRQFTRTGMFAAEGIEPVVAHSRPDSARSVITKRSTARTPMSVPSWNTPPPTSSWAGTDTGGQGTCVAEIRVCNQRASTHGKPSRHQCTAVTHRTTEPTAETGIDQAVCLVIKCG